MPKPIPSDRKCIDCKSGNTYADKNGMFVWHKKSNNYQCSTCKYKNDWSKLKNNPVLYKTKKGWQDKYHHQYYINNKDKIIHRSKEYYKKPGVKNKVVDRNRKRKLENPDKIYEYEVKHLKKYGSIVGLKPNQYKTAILTWASIVRYNDNRICQVCGSKEKLNAHHIFHKAKCPKLSLNTNNGITLCRPCHMESHHGYKY